MNLQNKSSVKSFLTILGISLTLSFIDMNYAMGFILMFSFLMLYVCGILFGMLLIANLLLWGRAKKLVYRSLFLLLFWAVHCMIDTVTAKYAMNQLDKKALAMRQDILKYKQKHGRDPENNEITYKINYLSFSAQYYSSTIELHKLFMEKQLLDVQTGEFGELISQN